MIVLTVKQRIRIFNMQQFLKKKMCWEVYTVVLYTQNEKPKDENIIYREYTGTDGEGTDGKYKVTGVTDWKDLHIATTSSLLQ